MIFTIFSPNSAGYVDATGSGPETIPHVYQNGRVTIFFCDFGQTRRIMPFSCKGRVVEWDQPVFETLVQKVGRMRIEGARAVIMLDVFKVCQLQYSIIRLLTPPPLQGPNILRIWSPPDFPAAPRKIQKRHQEQHSKIEKQWATRPQTRLRKTS